jgi:hypothetical protein
MSWLASELRWFKGSPRSLVERIVLSCQALAAARADGMPWPGSDEAVDSDA